MHIYDSNSLCFQMEQHLLLITELCFTDNLCIKNNCSLSIALTFRVERKVALDTVMQDEVRNAFTWTVLQQL